MLKHTMSISDKITILIFLLIITGCSIGEANMDKKKYITFFKDPVAIELITAVVNADKNTLSRLHSQHANFDVIGDYDNTPLRIAIKIDRLNVVKWLLSFGADPNFRTPKGTVAAKYAANHKNPEYLKALLKAGLNPNIKFSKTPIIFNAIESSRWKQYDMLVAAGADVLTTKAGDNSTVALYMAMQFEYERLKKLIKAGADVETPCNTGLSVVEELTNMQRRFSGNPEHPAYKMRVELLEMLRDKGLEIPDNIPGVTY
jgi:hypothetical protein